MPFPQERTRAPGILSPTRRAYYIERMRDIAAHVTHRDTGLPMTDAEQERFAHGLIASIEAVRADLQRQR